MSSWPRKVWTAGLTLVLITSGLVVNNSSAQTPRQSRTAARVTQTLRLEKLPNRKPRNVLFILTDDQRYDAMGFLHGQSFLKTPNLDALRDGGVYLPNAFVTTALCSPSRASILTGMYAHRHRVVDNDSPFPRTSSISLSISSVLVTKQPSSVSGIWVAILIIRNPDSITGLA